MKLHFIDARGELTDLHDWLYRRPTDTHEKAAKLMTLQSLDVIVQAGRNVIAEKVHLGYVPKPGLVFITVDLESAAFHANVNSSLERMFAHELHHVAWWDGPGYGSSLREALVSEGLAGHFVLELFGGPPEPWEQESETRNHAQLALREWDSLDYNHEAWFFGAGELPRWLGYSLGFRLVKRFLNGFPRRRASNLAGLDAEQFRFRLAEH
jgi:hypothetical protein